MKKMMEKLLKNERLKIRLCNDILDGTLSHAYIIVGNKGTGKRTIAKLMLAALACEKNKDSTSPIPCMSCASCLKILSGKSPDVIYINKGDKATIGVDVIRELKQGVNIVPNDLDVKLYIIEEAHKMTEEAQNAFLLTLEEPPPFVVFLLLCETTEPLLETIISRAPILRTELLDSDVLSEYLVEISPEAKRISKDSPENFSEIIAAADGSVGRALELINHDDEDDILNKRKLARDFVNVCISSNAQNSFYVMESFPRVRENLISFLNIIETEIRDIIAFKKCEKTPMCFFANKDECAKFANKISLHKLLNLYNALEETRISVLNNANINLAISNLLCKVGI